jgi:uncharacterized protein YjiK
MKQAVPRLEPLKTAVSEPLPSADPAESSAENEEEKERKRESKQIRDARRPLTSWERYRALRDALDEGLELVDLADHKSRFAFVIMGAVNVALFLAASQSEILSRIPDALWPWLAAYLALYGVVGIFFCLQAIEALRPRSIRPEVPLSPDHSLEEQPIGVRYFHDVVERDVGSHIKAWRDIRIGQLNAELARQSWALARINEVKYRALNRVYSGLKVMTFLAAGLLVVFAFGFVADDWGSGGSGVRLKDGNPERGGLSLLGDPRPFPRSGAKEPSGIAYHPALDRLFLVGDEGRLVEIESATGEVVFSDRIRGNVEDVAVHTPSGLLVLLSEKRSELVVYDPVERAERRRIRLDSEAILAAPRPDRNHGFEGLAFREDPSIPSGGTFYLVHQRSPAMVAAIDVRLDAVDSWIGSSSVLARFPLNGREDLTAGTYVPSLERMLVASDTWDRLLVLDEEGSIEAEIVLPGRQQEGIAVDGQGNLWVADEKAGLFRFDSALEALERGLAPPAR